MTPSSNLGHRSRQPRRRGPRGRPATRSEVQRPNPSEQHSEHDRGERAKREADQYPQHADRDVGDDLAPAMAKCDVVIDFSFHAATRGLLELAVAQKKPIVIGTTGHGAEEKKQLQELAARVPCVWA